MHPPARDHDQLVADASLLLAGAADDELDEAIVAVLGSLGAVERASRAHVVLYSDDGEWLFTSHEWCAAGTRSRIELIQDLPTARFGWSQRLLTSGEAVEIPAVDALPDEAAPERAAFERSGVRSALQVPMLVRGRVIGVVGLDHRSLRSSWDRTSVELMRRLGGAIATALLRRRATTEMRAARELAEDANRAKSEFLSRMSHELRTPLNAILGFAELLDDASMPEPDRRAVEQIRVSGQHLLALLEDVLDIGRVESGSLAFDIEPVSLAAAVQASVELVALDAARRGIEIRVQEVDRLVAADEQRIRQVLLNLLSNAVKYNRAQGSVTVRSSASQGWCRIDVVDTGPGIGAADLLRVFEPFDRLGAERSDVAGTGIGLTLTRRLVEHMGGSIGCTSTPGEGSCFWFELPLGPERVARPSTPPADVAATAVPTEPSVLCVDGDEGARLASRTIVERFGGWSTIEAGTAADAHAILIDKRPSMLVLDIGLVGAWAVLAAATGAGIPTVIITAETSPELHQRAIAGGAREVVVKPADVQQVRAAIGRHLGAVGTQASAAQRKPMWPVEPSGALFERADTR